MSHSSDPNNPIPPALSRNARHRKVFANIVRGLLLTIDVGVGAVLATVGVREFMIPLDQGGPLGVELPTAILCLLSASLGIWLVVSGVLLVWSKRPSCLRVGIWTHSIAALGMFLSIPAMFYQSQYEMQVRPGHMAMEGAMAMGVLSIVVGIVASLWLVAATVLHHFHRNEGIRPTAEMQIYSGEKESPK